MSKVFLISFDDGCIWDARLAALLSKYGMKGTFNLNSGLQNFVWELDGFPVYRQKLSETADCYQGHEVASHTQHHPWLDSLPIPVLEQEVYEDCRVIREIFGLDQIGFAVPFTACGEREIEVIKKCARYIRLSEETDSFALPSDAYHIPVHAMFNQEDIRERIEAFAKNTLKDSVFVMAGHSYELEAYDQWDYMEELLKYIRGFGFESMTTMEFVDFFEL